MFKSILIPVDLEEPSSWSKTLPVALVWARERNVRLTLGTVISDLEMTLEAEWSPFGYSRMVKEAEVGVRRVAHDFGPVSYDVEVTCGSIGSGILDLAERVDADLIVLASHRPSLKDYLIGAHALHVVRHAKCSVLVVRE